MRGRVLQIALDAMGGDLGTAELVAGAIQAVRQSDVRIVLLGDEELIREALQQLEGPPSDAIHIIHAPQVICMDETPFDAVRKKRDSSIVQAFHLLKEKKVDAETQVLPWQLQSGILAVCQR